tara:strand:- start:47 stop:265 length:219 start_codon:yes stop_codon:yes gene_type:complete
MQAVILSRVSSKDQEDRLSLDVQLMRLREYFSRKELSVLREFIIVESSNRGRRPEFEKMIDFIKSQKKKPQS